MSVLQAVLILNAAKKGWSEEARKKAALTRKRKAASSPKKKSSGKVMTDKQLARYYGLDEWGSYSSKKAQKRKAKEKASKAAMTLERIKKAGSVYHWSGDKEVDVGGQKMSIADLRKIKGLYKERGSNKGSAYTVYSTTKPKKAPAPKKAAAKSKKYLQREKELSDAVMASFGNIRKFKAANKALEKFRKTGR